MNELKLQSLLDYQRFSPNEKLSRLIEETEARYSGRVEITDEDSELVTAAAGTRYMKINPEKEIKI